MKKRYENLNGAVNEHGFRDMMKWMKERRGKIQDLSENIPIAGFRDVKNVANNRTKTSITWIGHSTFLIQMHGLNMITDPVWASRMGLQKRLTKPGYELSEMPEIDVVLISHGHYDHLDFPSIKRLKGNPAYYVPMGLKQLFIKKGYKKVYEVNWWDRVEVQRVNVSFVPAQHWTRRTLWDTNTSHWGGWIIENENGESIYFAGDTGYFDGFKKIGERFNIKAALMPIGAYEPEWFMKVSHINPEDAIKAFLELQTDSFIPMHYGAFRLADDTGPEALRRLLKEWERLELNQKKLKTLALGETCWLH
ncbi:MBL fold metallo-hydrolase [Bacillus nakamurai]|uniref:MBL fold metallo-hydrolase n=1 Tax=Bacillus nakamurai TaxID=1793963 RepID=UPI0007782162|nr:MBL fold metallo-hydrolase [Bacillus nakamurai]KXZ16587.1 MBL fold metallo-hydrolase [Bacillus nakamurai]